MRTWKRSRVILAVLVSMLVMLTVLPGVGMADDDNEKRKKPDTADENQQTITPADARPDLELTGGGFASPDNRRVIKFTIKNIGTAPSSAATRVRVVTSKPEPTPNFREIPLPPRAGKLLKPGESGVLEPGEAVDVVYSLAAECNGHIVQALVNDPLDLKPGNNAVNDKLVCATLPPPVDVGPSPRVIEGSGRLLKGDHNYDPDDDEYPSVLRRHGIVQENRSVLPFCLGLLDPGKQFSLGFQYFDDPGCDTNAVYQLIVDFDLTWLHDVKSKLIFRAELWYSEDIVTKRFSDPNAEALVDSCIGRVGLAPPNWPEIVSRGNSPDSLTPTLLPFQPVDGDGLLGRWDVTKEIQEKVAGQEFSGFVVHPSDANLSGESDSACLSHLRNLRLKLHYAIL